MEYEGQSKVLEKVKELMSVQGYSQPKLAELAGISFQSLNNYFAGRSPLTDKAAEKILSVFGLSIYEVLEDEYPVLNGAVRGYLEYNGEIKRINSFKDAENFVKKYREEVIELPKMVKADAALDAKNRRIATKNKVEKWDIVLDRVDTYDCSQVDVWAFRKTDDEREDITLALGNMCPGFDFEMDGQHFYGSEQAYICGLFSNDDPKHIQIQQALINETNGYGSKKQIRQKNEVLKRDDWESFNIEWMKYVVWNKVKNNQKFRDLLLSVPKNAYIVENSTHQKGRTAAIWGAKNQELEDARDRAVKYRSLTSQGKVKKEEESKARNSLNYLGVYEGKNLMGKILKLCQLALLEGKELDVDYELLRSKNIHLLGRKLVFEEGAIKAVIFDMDGTLIDTSILEELTEKIRSCKDENEKKRLWKELYELIPNCKRYDGMEETIKSLIAKGIKVCIVSGSAQQKIDKVVSHFGIPINKEFRFGRYALGRSWHPKLKPDPQPFINAVEKMGVKPGEVIALGNIADDIVGARNAGIKSAACLWGAEPSKEVLLKSNPDYVLEAPNDLLSIVFHQQK